MPKRITKIYHRLDDHMKEVVRGAANAFAVKFLGTGLAFGFNVLLARLLGAEGAGQYYLGFTVTTIAATLGRFGLDGTLVRFIATSADAGDWRAVKGIYKKSMGLVLLGSAIMAAAQAAAAPWLAEHVFSDPKLTEPMRWMALAVVPTVLSILWGTALQGLKRIRESMAVSLLWTPLFSCLAVFWLATQWGVRGAVWAYLCAIVLTALLGYLQWSKHTRGHTRGVQGRFAIGTMLQSCLPLYGTAVLSMVMQWSSTWMLGMWASTEDVGVFNVANRTASLNGFIMMAVGSISAPKFATLYQKGDLQNLNRVVRNSTKLMAMFALPGTIIFLLTPEWIMALFGTRFAEGAIILSILGVGIFMSTATGSVSLLLMMSGHEALLRNIYIVNALVTLGLNFLLIPRYGIVGAAIATVSALAVHNVIAALTVWFKLGIVTMPFLPAGRRSHKIFEH